ncbi:MAG: ATP-binding protein [Pseudomonadota bacterium]
MTQKAGFALVLISLFSALPVAALYMLHGQLDAVRNVQAVELDSPTSPSPPSTQWESVRLPEKLCRYECISSFKRYRVVVDIPSDGTLYLPLFDSAALVHLNGKLVAELGKVEPPVSELAYRPTLVALPDTPIRSAVVEVTVSSITKEGGRLGAFYLGGLDHLKPAYQLARILSVELTSYVSFVLALSVLLSLSLYLGGTRDRVFVWFATLCIAAIARTLGVITPDWPADALVRHVIYLGSTCGVLMSSVGFVVSYRRQHWHRSESVLAAIIVIVPVASFLLMQRDFYFYWFAFNVLIQVLGIITIPYVLWQMNRVTRETPSWIVGGVFGWLGVTAVFVLHDIYFIRYGETLVFQLSNLAGLSFVMAFLLLLVGRFISLRRSELQARHRLNDERRRLLADMHDTVAGRLAVLVQQSKVVSEPDSGMTESLRSTLRDLRAAMDSLDPELNTDVARALKQLEVVNRPLFAGAGVDLHWTVLTVLPDIQAEQVLHIVRIVQEALTNALRHAEASRVEVVVSHDSSGLTINVSDDGKGFASTEIEGRGLGIQRRRARDAGIRFKIESTPNAGTRVQLLMVHPHELGDSLDPLHA